MKIVADSHIPFVHDYFGTYGDLILVPGRAMTHAHVKDADILLVRSITHVDEKLLANTNVKFVGSVTAGADHLDTKWLEKAGIPFSVAAGFNAPPVADYVVSVIAALESKDKTKRKKAAVIGVGNVGRLVAEKLKLLNFDVILCDPIRADQEENFISTPLNEIADVDLISLHVPLIKQGKYSTLHFIDKDFLSRQKTGCILLNASRGAIIHFSELMQHGRHLRWCFDVWEHEPKIDKTILEQALIATPHIAGYSVQSKIRGINMIYRIACQKKIIAAQSISPVFMQDQTLQFSLNDYRWYDILLGVFNPLVMTAMMRTILLPAVDYGPLFDEMRNQFNYRYEFAYTKIVNANIPGQDAELLTTLGLTLK